MKPGASDIHHGGKVGAAWLNPLDIFIGEGAGQEGERGEGREGGDRKGKAVAHSHIVRPAYR